MYSNTATGTNIRVPSQSTAQDGSRPLSSATSTGAAANGATMSYNTTSGTTLGSSSQSTAPGGSGIPSSNTDTGKATGQASTSSNTATGTNAGVSSQSTAQDGSGTSNTETGTSIATGLSQTNSKPGTSPGTTSEASSASVSSASESPIDLITISGQTITANPTGFIIPPTVSGQPAQTLSPDGPPATIGGELVSLGTSGTLAIGTSMTVLFGLQNTGSTRATTRDVQPNTASSSASTFGGLPPGASVISTVIGGSTVKETFLPTTFSSYVSLTASTTISTTIQVGSSSTVIPETIWSGGVGWQYPSLTSGIPLLPAPSEAPSIRPSGPSQSVPLTTSSSAAPGSSVSTPVSGPTTIASQYSQTSDPQWATEAPLTTASSSTTPIAIATVSNVQSDGHTDHGGHPIPVFYHPHCFVSPLGALVR